MTNQNPESATSSGSDHESSELSAHARMTEWDKMLAGQHFDAWSSQLVKQRLKCRKLLHAWNNHPPAEFEDDMPGFDSFGPDSRRQVLADLFETPVERFREEILIEPPCRVNYGNNVTFKGSIYINMGLTILDENKVTFGSRVLVAPNVTILTPTHPVDVDGRRQGTIQAFPVEIGDDCWIGGGATLCGPCKLGNGVTVAAGAVVRGTDWPDNCVIGGVPARVLKRTTPPQSQVLGGV